jgi:hypothetical protein
MLNTENDDTDYSTGAEFHVDFTANQFLTETFAVGRRGSHYRQVTGDGGSGAALGDFKPESLGIGPGFCWTPKFGGAKLVLQGKWLHDLEARPGCGHAGVRHLPTRPYTPRTNGKAERSLRTVMRECARAFQCPRSAPPRCPAGCTSTTCTGRTPSSPDNRQSADFP